MKVLLFVLLFVGTALSATPGWNGAQVSTDSATMNTAATMTNIGGTTTANAVTAIVGVGTLFNSQVDAGDRISLSDAASTYVTVTSVTDNTHLTVVSALGSAGCSGGCTINLKKHLLSAADVTDTIQFLIQDNGNVQMPFVGANACLVTDSNYNVIASSTTPTELAYVHGVTSAIQTQLNAKQATLTLGNLTSPTTGVSVGSGTGAVVGSGTTVSVQTASGSQPGLLSAADWTTFNGKGAGTVTSAGVITNSTTSSIFTNTANAITGSPVTSSGNMTLSLLTQAANLVLASPTTGAAAAPAFRALVGADLPNPSSSSLGGVQSKAAVTSNFLTSISTSGVPAAAQPAFTDISGSVAASQMPALTSDVTTSAGAVATTVAKIQGTTVTGTTGTAASAVVLATSPTIASPTVTGTQGMSGGSSGGGDIVSSSGSYLTIGASGGKMQFHRTVSLTYLYGNMASSSDGTANIGCDSGGDCSATGAARMASVSSKNLLAYTALKLGNGANQPMNRCTLVAGGCTISNTMTVTSTTTQAIFCMAQALGTITVPVAYAIANKVASTSYDVVSANVADTSVVACQVINSAP